MILLLVRLCCAERELELQGENFSLFKVSMLKATLVWWKPDIAFLLFSCPLPLTIFPSSSSGGRMRCVKRRWANTLPTHANARLNLSHVTTGFLLSPRKVRERGCCSMDCAKATAVTAKVKQKDSRKTVRVRILVFFTAQMCWGCRSYRRGSLEKGHLGRAARRRSIRYQKNSEKVQ